ncbi:DUF2795 domain-containing protein [Desulfocurvibacter africanus]|uniref:DUF2795 domain-containing protein n=1 Tax=Desulfocurvibacter africanus TaxID=873 RepID=UPI0004838A28|nr:DUF2795 domain-containing protein [Desulfocurvibacter africanus]
MTRGVGGHSPANVAKFLSGINFPAKKKDLVAHAKKNKADKGVIDELQNFPDQEYNSMADVMKGYGKEH